jgi:membrane-associated protease RseP (regulator of RpoE activity)
MKLLRGIGIAGFWVLIQSGAFAQLEEGEDVPLMSAEERRIVEKQSEAFNQALSETLGTAAKSTVRIWGKQGRSSEFEKLAYGTVVGDGRQILTKWSEVEPALESLYVESGSGASFEATVDGVFTEEDLVLLVLGKQLGAESVESSLPAAQFKPVELSYGKFVTASQPNGKPAGFGVVSVLERNLRETDRAHLGIIADVEFRGTGVRIQTVQPEYGAAEAGLQVGDVILKVNDRKISGLQELRNEMSDKEPGDTVKLVVETAGKESTVEVLLSNRPMFGQFSGDRLNEMERMGGEPNRVRSGFSRVVQSDMKIQSDQVGGPVVDLQGNIVGVVLARADRTRTYLMGGEAITDLLSGPLDTVAEAQEKTELKRQKLAEQRRELMPRMRLPGKAPSDPERSQRHLTDIERLLDRVRDELETLGREVAP